MLLAVVDSTNTKRARKSVTSVQRDNFCLELTYSTLLFPLLRVKCVPMDTSMMMSGSRPALHAFLVNTNTEMARARIVRPIHSPRTALPQSANNVRWASSPRWISPARPVYQCTAGRHGSKGLCRACPAGFARNNTAPLDHCSGCLPGFYQDDLEQVRCLACIPGMYSDERSQSQMHSLVHVGQYRGDTDKELAASRASHVHVAKYTDEIQGSRSAKTAWCWDLHGARSRLTACLTCPRGSVSGRTQGENHLASHAELQGFVPNSKSTACEKPPHPTRRRMTARIGEYLERQSSIGHL